MDNVTQVFFNERQALADCILDKNNEKILAIFLDDGDISWDFVGDIGRHELIGVLHDLINQQLNFFDEVEE